MLKFWRQWTRLHFQRFPVKVGNDLLIGLIVGVALSIGLSMSAQWTLIVVMVYLCLTQIISMNTNAVFFDFTEFKQLGFNHPTLTYKGAYIIHYLLRDKYLSTIIALAISCACLLLTQQAAWIIFLVTALLANLLILPSHVYLSFRITSTTRMVYSCALLVPSAIAAVATLLKFHPSNHSLIVMSFVLLVGVMAYNTLIDQIAMRVHGPGRTMIRSRLPFLGFRRISVFLFKDAVLFSGMAGLGILTGIALFLLLRQGSPREMVPFCGLLALGSTNLLMARKDKQYRLLAEDSLFSELSIPRDRVFLRRSKLLTLTFSVMIQLLLYGLLIGFSHMLTLNHLPLVIVIMTTTLILDAPLLYQYKPLTMWMRTALKYCMIALFLMVTFGGLSSTAVYSYSVVVFMCYFPSAWMVYKQDAHTNTAIPHTHNSELVISQ